jgi:hypothetical protein
MTTDYRTTRQEDHERLHSKQTFGCLHGLIQAVEKEAGKLSKVVAAVTSLVALGFWSRGLWSCGPVVS